VGVGVLVLVTEGGGVLKITSLSKFNITFLTDSVIPTLLKILD
jgi:hypothetical protein